MKRAAVNSRCHSRVTQVVARLLQLNRQRRSLIAFYANESAERWRRHPAALTTNIIVQRRP